MKEGEERERERKESMKRKEGGVREDKKIL